LKPGDCNLYLRLLPGNSINSIGADNFKNYSTVNNDNSDTIVDTELAGMGGMKELNFRVGTSNQEEAFFELLTPYEGQSFCVEMNNDKKPTSLNIPINYIVQTSTGGKSVDGKLSLRINNERFGNNLLNIDEEVSKNFLKSIDENVLDSYMADGFSTDAIVSYTFIDKLGKEHTGATKSITLTLNEDCSNAKAVICTASDEEYSTVEKEVC